MRSPRLGVSMVPGHTALQRMPRLTKSMAMDLVSPITAALLAPYTKRLGMPLMLPATEAMLTIEPPPCSSMRGSNAWIIKYIERTLRLKEKSQSFCVQSRMVPWCTKPAQLTSTSGAAISAASAAIAASSVTSSLRTWMPGVPASSPQLVQLDVGGDHRGAFAREGERGGAPDALRGRRHQAVLPCSLPLTSAPPMFGAVVSGAVVCHSGLRRDVRGLAAGAAIP